jgi:hypothetical protein
MTRVIDTISANEGTARAGSIENAFSTEPGTKTLTTRERAPRPDLLQNHESIEAFIARRLRQRPTPQSVVEAVWYCVREHGLAALREPANQKRLAATRAQLNRRIAKAADQKSEKDLKNAP